MACIQLADPLSIARYANTMRPLPPAHAALSFGIRSLQLDSVSRSLLLFLGCPVR